MPDGVYPNLPCSRFVKDKSQINTNPFPISNAQPHQQAVVDYFVHESPHKGILLFHELGSGKTCTAIFIADEMLRLKKIRHVFVLTPGSLRANWITEYCTKCGSSRLSKDYTFLTYNYDISPYLDALDFNNCLIIIDESHNVIHGFQNEEQTKSALIAKINSSNCQVIMMSATPFYNHTFEWTVLGNILKPNVFRSVFKDDRVNMQAWASEEERITDQMLRGIISYFPGNRNDYPTVTREAPILINRIEKNYLKLINKTLENEQKTIRFGPPKPELALDDPVEYKRAFTRFMMAIQFLLSRQLSNLYTYGRNTVGGKYLADLDVSEGGWMVPELLQNPGLDVLSPKIAALIRNMIRPDHLGRKQVIYSRFKRNGGIWFIKTLFDYVNKCLAPDARKMNYLLYTGDETESQRIQTLNQFNSPANRFGQIYNVLLMTEAGIEGITLKDVGHMHILESHNIGGKMEQAIGRVARYESHINMPDNMKTVSIWRYFVTPKDGVSIDQLLYDNAERNKKSLQEFYDRLIENSVENSSDYDVDNAYVPSI